MLLHDPPTGGAAPGSPQGEGPRRSRVRSWWARAVLVLAVLLALVAGTLAVLVVDDGAKGTAVTTSTVAAAPTPTSVPASTSPAVTTATTSKAPATTAPVTVPPDTASAVWPSAAGPAFTSPVTAARGFAVDFVGFTSPVVGSFRQGDARSGEVDVRPKAGGPVTTVFVRQLGSGGRWFVLGSATGNIQVTEPSALATVASPVRLRGTSTAFEANVSVEVRQDGTRQPIGTGFVMGGSMGEVGPFDGTVSFRRPTARAGAVLLLTHSMDDGRVWEASTVRVAF
jgi:hypothetical protein